MKKNQSKRTEGEESPLKALRRELDISQEEFGRILGISSRTIARWEAGTSVPTFTIAQVKAFLRLLQSHNKSIYDLPDDIAAPSVKRES
jgi:DNA-binding transcriptional regulator YiaG